MDLHAAYIAPENQQEVIQKVTNEIYATGVIDLQAEVKVLKQLWNGEKKQVKMFENQLNGLSAAVYITLHNYVCM